MAIKRLIPLFLLCLFGLSGCVLTTAPGVVMVGITTLVATDKTVSDHALSIATGDDCSTVEFTRGREYCVDTGNALSQADTALYGPSGNYRETGPFCYRTLGEVTCYNHPDPVASENARLH